MEEAKTTPNPTARGPPMLRNFSLGAHMATVDRPPTMPAVYQAALIIRGPPSRVMGAMTAPITPGNTGTNGLIYLLGLFKKRDHVRTSNMKKHQILATRLFNHLRSKYIYIYHKMFYLKKTDLVFNSHSTSVVSTRKPCSIQVDCCCIVRVF